jgi:antitoxin HicB
MANYKYDITPDDNGTFLVTVPALPEVTTFSDTEEEAQLRARAAIEEALAARIASGREAIPTDAPDRGERPLLLPLLTELKVDLFNSLIASGLSRAELARRLDWHRNSVDRLFDLNHHSRLEQVEEAFRVLGYTRPSNPAPVFAMAS